MWAIRKPGRVSEARCHSEWEKPHVHTMNALKGVMELYMLKTEISAFLNRGWVRMECLETGITATPGRESYWSRQYIDRQSRMTSMFLQSASGISCFRMAMPLCHTRTAPDTSTTHNGEVARTRTRATCYRSAFGPANRKKVNSKSQA